MQEFLSKKDKSASDYLDDSLGGLQLPSAVSTAPTSDLKVGDRVIWHDCPGTLEAFNPFTVCRVQGCEIWLDWIEHPVARTRLILDSKNE